MRNPIFKILFYNLFEKLASDINIEISLIKPSTSRELNFVPRISYGIIPSLLKKIIHVSNLEEELSVNS